jgi:dihydrofolate reductase
MIWIAVDTKLQCSYYEGEASVGYITQDDPNNAAFVSKCSSQNPMIMSSSVWRSVFRRYENPHSDKYTVVITVVEITQVQGKNTRELA